MVNKSLKRALSIKTAVILVFSWVITAVAVDLPPVQSPPLVLRASQVLPPEMISGLNFKVDDFIRNDGLINTYRLETAYGPLTVETTAFLKQRQHELKALHFMEELQKTDVFKEAFKEAAKGPLKTAKGLVTEPVDTVSGAVTGVGRWFSDIGRAAVSSDPHQEGVMKTAVGHAPAKRNFAYEYGVDPYSSYPPLQESLDNIAWAATGGGLTVRAAFMAIPDAAGIVVSATGTAAGMKKLVRDNSPAELAKINKKKLRVMKVPDSIASDFLNNPNFNPQETTLLVGELESMKGVKNRQHFIDEASGANLETVALYMRLRAQMMAEYNLKVEKGDRIIGLNGVSFLMTKKGVVVGVYPLDHVASTSVLWQKEAAVAADLAKRKDVRGQELWVLGTVTSTVREAMEARGWKVTDRAGKKLGMQ